MSKKRWLRVSSTALAGAAPAMRIANDEAFGPALPLFRFDSGGQAITMASDAECGPAAHLDSSGAARIRRNEASGASTVLFGMAQGIQSPRHRHMGIGQTFVLEGCFEDQDGIIPAGSFAVRAAGSVPQCFNREGSLHLAFLSRPDRLVDTHVQVRF